MFLCVVSTRFSDILRASVRQAAKGVSSLSRCIRALLGPTLLHKTIAPVTEWSQHHWLKDVVTCSLYPAAVRTQTAESGSFSAGVCWPLLVSMLSMQLKASHPSKATVLGCRGEQRGIPLESHQGGSLDITGCSNIPLPD